MKNVVNLDGSEKDVQIQNQIVEARKQLPLILEVAKLKSQYQKERFDTLKQEGFTEEQSLSIVESESTPFD